MVEHLLGMQSSQEDSGRAGQGQASYLEAASEEFHTRSHLPVAIQPLQSEQALEADLPLLQDAMDKAGKKEAVPFIQHSPPFYHFRPLPLQAAVLCAGLIWRYIPSCHHRPSFCNSDDLGLLHTFSLRAISLHSPCTGKTIKCDCEKANRAAENGTGARGKGGELLLGMVGSVAVRGFPLFLKLSSNFWCKLQLPLQPDNVLS